MLLFSTILSVKSNLTKDKFIRLVINWNQNNLHQDNIISNINWSGEKNIKFEDGNLSLEIEEYAAADIIAIRYEKKDDKGVIWDTDYVMNFGERKMAISLERSYLENAVFPNQDFSTPQFISSLIEGGYLENDADLAISKRAHYVEDKNIEKIADVINGKRYNLPVVYVSATKENNLPLEVDLLASRLKGVAHVLAEKSTVTTAQLKELCGSKNEYDGDIGIYYPISQCNHRRFLYSPYQGDEKNYLERIVQAVISYSTSKMLEPLYTWQGVKNALLYDRIEKQKLEREKAEKARKEALTEILALKGQQENIEREALEKAKEEADAILEGFDDDYQRLQEHIEELNEVNKKLEYENQWLKTKIAVSQDIPLLFMGKENDVYPGEIKDLILSALEDQLVNIENNSRRYDVVQDIIQANDYQEFSKKKADELKLLLNNYNGMTPKVRTGLEELGFAITHDGGHYKLKYNSDDRYVLIYGSTPSDGKAGKNNASITIKKVF